MFNKRRFCSVCMTKIRINMGNFFSFDETSQLEMTKLTQIAHILANAINFQISRFCRKHLFELVVLHKGGLLRQSGKFSINLSKFADVFEDILLF